MSESPSVSVIIPVYNDAEGISKTLESMINQSYATCNQEIIVIDNNSNDNSKIVAERFSEKAPHINILEETKIQSSYAARNTGIKHASGNIIAFLDADVWVEQNYIESLASLFTNRDVDYVGCSVEVRHTNPNSIGQRYNKATGFPVKEYMRNLHFAPTCCLATRRQVFDRVGPFDNQLISGGDREFGDRVHEAGFEFHYEPEITVYHPARDLRSLWDKFVRIGRGTTQIESRYPDLFDDSPLWDPRNYIPPLPTTFVDQVKSRDRVASTGYTVEELFAFYIIEYALGLAHTWGRLQQKFIRLISNDKNDLFGDF